MVLQAIRGLEGQERQPPFGRGEKPTHHGLHHQGRRGLHHRHRGVQGTCHFGPFLVISCSLGNLEPIFGHFWSIITLLIIFSYCATF